MKSEFEFIENLRNKIVKRGASPSVSRVGIGDDCAVLPKDAKTDLVMTTDLLVEDIDFRLDWTTPEFLGHKALAVSLSDVAAMGAKPVWSMISIGVPASVWKTDFVERFYDGYLRLARKFDVELIGGDTSKTPDKIVVDSIAAGEVERGKAVLRVGARVGDSIFVTGELGGAAAGLTLLENGVRYRDSAEIRQKNLLLRQLQPHPHIYTMQKLTSENSLTAMIDLSDGLSSDLAHLCRASRVGAKIYAVKIPAHKSLGAITDSFDEKLNYALNGGEDFELLFTVNPEKNSAQKRASKRGFSHIGEITANAETIELDSGGETRILEPKGFRHF